MEPFETPINGPLNGQSAIGNAYWKKFSPIHPTTQSTLNDTQQSSIKQNDASIHDSFKTSAMDPMFNERAHYPMMYDICLSANPHTPVDFLEFVLEGFFHKSPEDARQMSEILSHGGEMPCARCTRDIAETKIEQVMDFIEENPYTVECKIKES